MALAALQATRPCLGVRSLALLASSICHSQVRAEHKAAWAWAVAAPYSTLTILLCRRVPLLRRHCIRCKGKAKGGQAAVWRPRKAPSSPASLKALVGRAPLLAVPVSASISAITTSETGAEPRQPPCTRPARSLYFPLPFSSLLFTLLGVPTALVLYYYTIESLVPSFPSLSPPHSLLRLGPDPQVLASSAATPPSQLHPLIVTATFFLVIYAGCFSIDEIETLLSRGLARERRLFHCYDTYRLRPFMCSTSHEPRPAQPCTCTSCATNSSSCKPVTP